MTLRTKPDTGTAHTPGPWHFGPMHGWIGMCIMRKPSSEYGPQGTIGDAPIAKVIDGAAHWENSYPVEANARLIAAAPELLGVAKRILERGYVSENIEEERGDHLALAAAIARAEGRQP
ncbi:MAG: hypothetical protein ACTHOP_22230 [Mesorhizobium sp.]